MLKLTEFQSVKASGYINIPFSIAWSHDNFLAFVTDKGVNVVGGGFNKAMAALIFSTLFISLVGNTFAGDITQNVFGYQTDFVPAAFGDFNSDEYTDVFVIKNNKRTVEILLGSDSEPLLKHDKDRKLECSFDEPITSVVPGDFDGDALLDLLVTVNVNNQINSVRILWGDLTTLNCSQANESLFRIYGQPLAVSYNEDMITDLFGEDQNRNRTFWVFNNTRSVKPKAINMLENSNRIFHPLKYPHSNAFIDLNRDSSADLYLSVEDNSYDVWLYNKEKKLFEFGYNIPGPPDDSYKSPFITGQTLFMDVQLDGKLDHVVPVCFHKDCTDSAIYVHSLGKWHNLGVNFHGPNNTIKCGFVPPEISEVYYFTNTITLHSGDYNMDGYPDLLATLKKGNVMKSYLLENVECEGDKCDGFPRTFNVLWSALSPYNNGTNVGVFFDFSQNGVLDILFVHDKKADKPSSMFVSALKNTLDYDANFIKVMVLTGLTNKNHSTVPTPLKRMRKIYGTSFPGPIIWYKTTTQDGNRRAGVAAQLPQSAYFSLQLPYTLFGLGRTPNFVDTLDIGLDGQNKTWTQIIPNSQLIVIPKTVNDPKKWIAQLFVTPSKVIVQTIIALLGTCALISIIIIILWWKERREDHFEKLQDAHKFHFDAM